MSTVNCIQGVANCWGREQTVRPTESVNPTENVELSVNPTENWYWVLELQTQKSLFVKCICRIPHFVSFRSQK